MYRTTIDSILVFGVYGDVITFKPCIQKGWNNFEITYRKGKSKFFTSVVNIQRQAWIEFDGKTIESNQIEVQDDGSEHKVLVKL